VEKGINEKDANCSLHLGWDEMPVYPQIARIFGLSWWKSDIEIRRQSNLKFHENMDLEVYISEYIDWCYDRWK